MSPEPYDAADVVQFVQAALLLAGVTIPLNVFTQRPVRNFAPDIP